MSWTSERARVASLTRSRAPDDPDLLAARRNLQAARLEDQVARAVDDPAQLARAARIVRTALARQRLTLADLTAAPSVDGVV